MQVNFNILTHTKPQN